MRKAKRSGSNAMILISITMGMWGAAALANLNARFSHETVHQQAVHVGQ